MKPSKSPIVLNSVCLVLYAAVAALCFLADKPVFGWIWVGYCLIWAVTIAFSVRTYRVRRETYELVRRWFP